MLTFCFARETNTSLVVESPVSGPQSTPITSLLGLFYYYTPATTWERKQVGPPSPDPRVEHKDRLNITTKYHCTQL